MEHEMNILNSVNVGSIGDVISLSRMNPDSWSGIYVTSLLQKKWQLMNKERERQTVKNKSRREP